MTEALKYIAVTFAILAALFAFGSATEILHGDLESGLTHGWIEFATSYPVLFAIVLVAGAVVIGPAFVSAVDN